MSSNLVLLERWQEAAAEQQSLSSARGRKRSVEVDERRDSPRSCTNVVFVAAGPLGVGSGKGGEGAHRGLRNDACTRGKLVPQGARQGRGLQGLPHPSPPLSPPPPCPPPPTPRRPRDKTAPRQCPQALHSEPTNASKPPPARRPPPAPLVSKPPADSCTQKKRSGPLPLSPPPRPLPHSRPFGRVKPRARAAQSTRDLRAQSTGSSGAPKRRPRREPEAKAEESSAKGRRKSARAATVVGFPLLSLSRSRPPLPPTNKPPNPPDTG